MIEKVGAVTTAGLLLAGVGVFIISLPRGVWFGVACLVVGGGTVVVSAIAVWHLWRTEQWTPRRTRTLPGRAGLISFLVRRLGGLFGASLGVTTADVVRTAFFNGGDSTLWGSVVFGSTAIVSGTLWLILRRRPHRRG